MIWNESGHDRIINMLRMQEFTERIFLDKDYLDKIKRIDKDCFTLYITFGFLRNNEKNKKYTEI